MREKVDELVTSVVALTLVAIVMIIIFVGVFLRICTRPKLLIPRRFMAGQDQPEFSWPPKEPNEGDAGYDTEDPGSDIAPAHSNDKNYGAAGVTHGEDSNGSHSYDPEDGL